ncbi:hypothetical protein D1823_13505 [Ruegeria sp. AD91A]|nr:hypothetical protein D1823_13505 [Ruegeria sp. AD91A]
MYRIRHKIENLFGRLKERFRVATRYDRCFIIFMSAIALAEKFFVSVISRNFRKSSSNR